MAIFDDITPTVEPLSLDEAFLDVTGRVRQLGPASRIARTVRARVNDEVGLTCSVGVAHNKFLAKLASESAKPTASPTGPVFGPGITVVDPASVESFLWPQPARALWGIGPATMEKLARLGVVTIGDIARLPLTALESALGSASGMYLHRLSSGLDDRPVVPDAVAKSISHEETFATDVVDRRVLDHELVRLSDAVGDRLRRSEQFARTVVLKVRFGDFRTISRSRTVKDGIEDGPTVAGHARDLLDEVDLAGGVRLIGVGVSGLADSAHRAVQLSMLDAAGQATSRPDVRPELHRAMDEIRGRYGRSSIGPARLAPSPDSGRHADGRADGRAADEVT